MVFNLTKFKDDEVNTAGTKANLEKLASEIADMNYTDFTEGEDFKSLAKRYSTQGQKAMDDTIGKVAARTGGIASSYATAAGNQAYNDYMGKLEDAARAMYDDQRQEKVDNLGISKMLYDQNYQEKRDRKSDVRYWDDKTRTLTEDEKASLANELYYNANAYPTYADYKTAFPGTLLTEADFNQVKGTATGMYADKNKVVEPVDPGALTEYQKMVIQQYNNAIGEDGKGTVSSWLQEEYEKIFGNAPTLERLATQARAATSETEFQSIVLQIVKLGDQELADTLTAEWEEKNQK
jgi:hypothetical protein